MYYPFSGINWIGKGACVRPTNRAVKGEVKRVCASASDIFPESEEYRLVAVECGW